MRSRKWVDSFLHQCHEFLRPFSRLRQPLSFQRRSQISTDGFNPYPRGTGLLGIQIKNYSNPDSGRYAPPNLCNSDRRSEWVVQNPWTITTSHVERNNLTIRTFMKRFARLTLGFSKKLPNLRAAVALHTFYYNFCRIHGSLKMTPAMKAGVTDRLWSLEDLFGDN